MTRRELVEEQAARIAATAPRNGRRPRLKRGPCDRCGAKIPAASRYASHCAECRKVMYRMGNLRARRAHLFRHNGYVFPPRPCGCRGRGRHRVECKGHQEALAGT